VPVVRILTNYEASLSSFRCLTAVLLVILTYEPHMHGSFLLNASVYYLISGLLLLASYKRWNTRWRLWQIFCVTDLVVISELIGQDHGFNSDLYYLYFLSLAMFSIASRSHFMGHLGFAAVTAVIYSLTLLLHPLEVDMGHVIVRLSFFLAVSAAFPLLSYLEYQRQAMSSESSRLSIEKERLELEMESMNRQVAEYAFDLHRQAVLDPLTQLYNHTYFLQNTMIEVEKSKQSGRPLSLLLFDLDNFKKINDTYGHLIGDKVLLAVSDRLQRLVQGTYYTACRVGGEEMAVILPDSKLDEAFQFAEQVRHTLNATPIDLGDGHRLTITVSIGLATITEACNTQQKLIDNADQAMYLAKRTGKNRTCRYTLLEERKSL